MKEISDRPIEDSGGDVPELVPARMLNEFSYCPRLFYLEWVQGEFAESYDTLEGSHQHRRVREETGISDESVTEDDTLRTLRSVLLSAEKAGLTAKIDLLEAQGLKATPVDYKKGRAPDVIGSAWESDKIQVCAQAIILRENGFICNEAVLYYAGSKRRVKVAIDEVLIERTMGLLNELRKTAAEGQIPPPLENSPKCPRCSLAGICLPDETNLLTQKSDQGVRRIVPARDDRLPVYVQEQGYTVSKRGECLQIRKGKEVRDEVRLMELDQVCVFGNVQVTTQTIKELCSREIPICYYSYGGWFYGITSAMAHKNVELRLRQYEVALSKDLYLGRQFVSGKVQNSRTLLRRNHSPPLKEPLEELRRLRLKAMRATSLETLLGLEGAAARIYFGHFSGMLSAQVSERYGFENRNRRPPRDPVNAVLSFAYALLVKDITVILLSTGFDPYLGFYHRPRYGRPALALDLAEEFRPLIGDSVVLSSLNGGEIKENDFVSRAGATALTSRGRAQLIAAYERRLDSLITHPLFGYAVSYRRVIAIQARLLARYLQGEIDSYQPFCTR